MKRVLALVIILSVLAGIVWAFRSRPASVHQAQAVVAPKVMPLNKTVPPTVKPPPLMASSEWEKYRSARQSVLDSNPSLQDDYKKILQEMDDQQTKLDAAMEKADPKLVPVIAKLQALRARNGTPNAFPKASGSSPAPTMTADDWQELRSARAKAVQTYPSLMTVSKKLQDQMRSFEASLDAAMVKADPSVRPVIVKFEGRPALVSNLQSPSR